MRALYLYTKYYRLVIYHVLNFVMTNKGCLVSQTMPGFLSFVDLDYNQSETFPYIAGKREHD